MKKTIYITLRLGNSSERCFLKRTMVYESWLVIQERKHDKLTIH